MTPPRVLFSADARCVAPGEVSRLIEAAGTAAGQCVLLVPAHDRDGTNAILAAPLDTLPPSFGPDRCARHVTAADRLRRKHMGVSPP